MFAHSFMQSRVIAALFPTVGIISTIAGNNGAGSTDGLATSASFSYPRTVATDSSGNIYIADTANNKIRKITVSTGMVTTIAGSTAGSSGDGGLATAAKLNGPYGIALDASNNIYIADTQNNKIRMITASTGIITTVAGTGTASGTATGANGDGGLATAATLNSPYGVTVSTAGVVYIADSLNNRVRKFTAGGNIVAYAGTGVQSSTGDGSSALTATLSVPQHVSILPNGTLYIGEGNYRIRSVTSGGIINAFAGTGVNTITGDGGLATAATIGNVSGIVANSTKNAVYISGISSYSVIRKIDLTTGIIVTVAGGTTGYSGDGGLAISAGIGYPQGMAFDSSGNFFFIQPSDAAVRKITNIY